MGMVMSFFVYLLVCVLPLLAGFGVYRAGGRFKTLGGVLMAFGGVLLVVFALQIPVSYETTEAVRPRGG